MTVAEDWGEEPPERDADPLPSYDLPSGRPVLSPDELARRVLAAAGPAPFGATDCAPGATALLIRRLLARGASDVVAVTPTREAARALRGDLEFVLHPAIWSDEAQAAGTAEPRILLLDGGEASPYGELAPDRRTTQQRLATLVALAEGTARPGPLVVIVPATTLVRKVVPRAVVREHSLRLELCDELELSSFTRRLEELGYVRAPLVEDPAS